MRRPIFTSPVPPGTLRYLACLPTSEGTRDHRVGPALVLLTLLALPACIEAGEDGRVPGEELGAYAVDARLETSTCGPDAFGSPDTWDFDIRLSRDDDRLFWLDGAAFSDGVIDDEDGRFRIQSGTATQLWEPGATGTRDAIVVDEGSVEVRLDDGSTPGCTLLRDDTASGSFDGAELAIDELEGTLSYRYSATGDSDCSPVVGIPGGPTQLPCEIIYRFTATRR